MSINALTIAQLKSFNSQQLLLHVQAAAIAA